MVDAAGSVTITYNGEIYNFSELRRELSALGHRFQTQSDTEVILKAYRQWDCGCLDRLRGMFAFVLWDAGRERLFIARDRFGKKPLFLQPYADGIAFASEIKALLTLPGATRRLEAGILPLFLMYRYVPAPATFFDGIRKLLPGSYLLWENGQMVERRYYVPPDAIPQADIATSADPVAEILDRLDEAVRIRMVSDVPFGAFLSGGIDSSAIVGLMTRHSACSITTFSVGFAEPRYSELAYAAEVARHFGTRHNELVIRQQDVIEELPLITRFRDAPVGEPSDVPIYRLSREAARSVKMVLTGEGSDEILGGYPKHVIERFVPKYQSLVSPELHRVLVEPLSRYLPYRHRRLATLLANIGLRDTDERFARWFGAMSRQEIETFCRTPPVWSALRAMPRTDNTSLRRILAFDQSSWLPDNLLERGDRMTMAASIEARMPFMDHELIAFVASQPDRYRIRRATTKWILRQAMRRILPDGILKRPKVGFRVPVNEWFRREWRNTLTDALTGPSSLSRDLYQPERVRNLLTEHISGRRNHEKTLWTLLTLEIFQREYGVTM
jgi:asparagine synthase (glutamine-hydrolysing)